MRRAAVLAAIGAAVLAAGASPASSATPRECRGLMVCVPVAGPWVAVPSTPVQFLLSCPRGYIVGGTDAELSDRAIDVVFLGTQGAPVNPGITTTRDALFVGTYVGSSPSAPTFRPHLGCIPTAGGGGRVPTSVRAFPPGKPAARHARTVSVPLGIRRITLGCAPSERLVSGWHAIAFRSKAPPASDLVHGVSATQRISNGHVVVSVQAAASALVQVGALCAGGR